MDKLKNWIQKNIHKMDVDEPNTKAWDRLKDSLVKSEESDLLKNHIATNKSELEIESPTVQSWKEISNSITTKKTASIQHIKRRITYLSAACIIVIVGLGIFRYMNVAQIDQDKKVAKKNRNEKQRSNK